MCPSVNSLTIRQTISHQVLLSDKTNPSAKDRCFKVLRKVSQAHAILPQSYNLAGVTLSDTTPYTSGDFADIWKAELDGRQVTVKAFRAHTAANLEKIKRVRVIPFEREGECH